MIISTRSTVLKNGRLRATKFTGWMRKVLDVNFGDIFDDDRVSNSAALEFTVFMIIS